MKSNSVWKIILPVLTILVTVSVSSAARAEWQFGIGTGLTAMKAEGDMGFHVIALDTPVQIPVDLEPEDFNDYMESAFGFGGFASDGKWMVLYSLSNLKLEGGGSVVHEGLGGDTTVQFDTEFEMTSAELVVGYPFYQGESLILRAHTGLRYTGHELTTSVTATGTVNDQRRREIDEDWTDVLIGVMADVRLAEKWNWSTRLDGGWGGSEGTYFVTTGVAWQFHKHWSATLYGRYMAVDFENDSKGDPDWYLYDVDESAVGLNFMFIW